MAFEGSQRHATTLASHPRGMPWPRLHVHVVLPLLLSQCVCKGLGNVPLKALLPTPKGMPACPRKHAMALATCLDLGYCMPRPWQHAHEVLPWPWHALALAVACSNLGCLPIRATLALAACPWGLPWPWQHALGRQWASQGHACVHAVPNCLASSYTPAKLACACFHFYVPKFIP